MVVAFAHELLADKLGQQSLPSPRESKNLRHRWIREARVAFNVFNSRVLFSRDHVHTALRHIAKVLIAFSVGFFGYKNIDKPYDAGAANVVAIMLNRRSLGGELQKNLSRVQGVVLGTVVGEISASVFGGCSWFHHAARAVILGLGSGLSLFIYFHSAHYTDSYTGFLMAVFFSKGLAKHCSDDYFSYQAFYDTVVDIVVALLIVVGLDSACESSTSATQASTAYLDAWRSLRSAVNSILKVPDGGNALEHRSSEVRQKLARASEFGEEASQEPRYWRIPWRAQLFSEAICRAHHARYNLSCMEFALAGSSRSISGFESIQCMPSFMNLVQILDRKLSLMEDKLLCIFVHESTMPMETFQHELVWEDFLENWAESVRVFMSDFEARGDIKDRPSYPLETDPQALISLLVVSMDSILYEVRHLHRAIMLE